VLRLFRALVLISSLLSLPVALSSAQSSPTDIFRNRLSTVQYVSVAVGPDQAVAAPGGSVSLWVDVTPKPNIRVYGAGAKGFTPVALTVSMPPEVSAGRPKYPSTELLETPGLDERVPVYRTTFRIVQPITVARTAKRNSIVMIAGTLKYESCDDRLCYPLASLPISWNIHVQ
jgi:hypothetical protein